MMRRPVHNVYLWRIVGRTQGAGPFFSWAVRLDFGPSRALWTTPPGLSRGAHSGRSDKTESVGLLLNRFSGLSREYTREALCSIA